jgi:hypothetical protein
MNLIEIIRDIAQDCDCGLSEGMKYHINTKTPLTENVYRPSSKKYFQLFEEARQLHKEGKIQLSEEDTKILENTDLGKFATFKGVRIPLDFPMSYEQLTEAKHQGKDVQLNKPKRGGSKKFYVFVRKPGGGIKKISFGDTTGLKAKINNPKARKSFAARHKCAQNKDRTSAGYWACRLPRYSKMLGIKSNFSGYW